MRRIGDKKRNIGRVVTGLLVGGAVGATVGLLMAPISRREDRGGSEGQTKDIQQKMKVAEDNIENQARALMEQGRKTLTRHGTVR